jgi:D-ribose pyranase
MQVLNAVHPNFVIGEVFMAQEFREHNTPAIQAQFAPALAGLRVTAEPNTEFIPHVSKVIGLIRTGDTIQYANMILVSA